MNIRPIKSEDQTKIEELFSKKDSKLAWDFSNFLDHPDCFGLVVLEKKNIVGFGAMIRYIAPLHGEIGRLEDIFVDPKHQGKGYGKKIISELITIAEQLNLNQIVLTSNPKRQVARHIYTSLGFDLHETGLFIKNLRD